MTLFLFGRRPPGPLMVFVLLALCFPSRNLGAKHEINWMGSFGDVEKCLDMELPKTQKLVEFAFEEARLQHNCRTFSQAVPSCLVKEEIHARQHSEEQLQQQSQVEVTLERVHNVTSQGVKYRDFSSSQGFVTFPYLIGWNYFLTLHVSVKLLPSTDAGQQCCASSESRTTDNSEVLIEHNMCIFESPNGRHITKHIFYPLLEEERTEEDHQAEPDPEGKEDKEGETKVTSSESRTNDRIELEVILPGSEYLQEHVVEHTPSSSTTATVQQSHPEETSASSPTSFKVVSYNIWNYNPPWSERLAAMVDEIVKCSPDIVALQEVRFSYTRSWGQRDAPSTHQASDFATQLKSHGYSQHVFQAGMTYLQAQTGLYSHVDEGLAILSRFPILETSYIQLTRNFSDKEDEHQRICLRASVAVDPRHNKTVNVFVTHMSLSESARQRNILEIWDFVQRHSSSPQIIAGDFNAEPLSPSIQFLIGKETIGGVKADFKDAWLEGKALNNSDNKGLSNPDPNVVDGWTYITLQPQPKKRIDFLMYRGDNIQLQEVDIVAPNEKINWDQISWKPSDHRGLYATWRYV